ncbi:MAG TPA: hypothetical protein VF655_11425 [Allosphingosinicella sp.]|jgi:hypothetical protein
MAPLPVQSATLARALPPDPALNFAALRAEAIAFVQRCSGAIWTDYNEHDPGVTILEQLCYALTELGYRAGFPIEDLIAGEEGLLPGPGRAFPTEPVTVADWRRLLIDRVRGLGNAWLEPRLAPDGGPTGLYDIRLYAAPPVPGLHEEWREEHRIVERAERAFVRHRALCEDIGSIRRLEPARTRVRVRIEIDPGARPEAAMAAIVQRLACTLAPEPRRRSLQQRLDEGLSLSQIFDGPRISRGFIAPGDLADQCTTVHAQELRDHLAVLPEVRAVGGLRVGVWDEEETHGSWAIPKDHYFAFDSGLDRGDTGIELLVQGRPVAVDRHETVRLLKALWREHRRTYKVNAEIYHLLTPPAGGVRDIGAWAPVVDQFPRIYGVGPNGVGRDASIERRAQARQLTGYLEIFDAAMRDFLLRLARLGPMLRGEGPERPGARLEEENRLIDFLLALHGEDAEGCIVLPPGCTAEEAARLRLHAKRRLLADEGGIRKSRGRGLDYRVRRWRRRTSGVEMRSQIMLASELCLPRRRRPRLTVIEHVLLRRRRAEEQPDTGWRPMTATAIVHLPGGHGDDAGYRRRVEAMIRANTPAHVALETRFVDREHWVRFRRLHKLWRWALRDDLGEAADLLAEEMLARFEDWTEKPF